MPDFIYRKPNLYYAAACPVCREKLQEEETDVSLA